MEYQFRPLGKKCAATGAELVPGSVVHSVLVQRDGDLVRLDYSPEGWTEPPEGALASWVCSVPLVAVNRNALLEPQRLQGLFDELTEEYQPANERMRYVLALWLLQKKRLRLEGSRATDDEEDAEFLQLVGASGEGLYEVQDFRLSAEEMKAAQEQVYARLAAGWGEAA